MAWHQSREQRRCAFNLKLSFVVPRSNCVLYNGACEMWVGVCYTTHLIHIWCMRKNDMNHKFSAPLRYIRMDYLFIINYFISKLTHTRSFKCNPNIFIYFWVQQKYRLSMQTLMGLSKMQHKTHNGNSQFNIRVINSHNKIPASVGVLHVRVITAFDYTHQHFYWFAPASSRISRQFNQSSAAPICHVEWKQYFILLNCQLLHWVINAKAHAYFITIHYGILFNKPTANELYGHIKI